MLLVKNSLFPVVGLDRPTLDKDIKSLGGNFEWIFIDGAPQLVNMSISAIKCADIILIPVPPSPYDIWASEDLVDVILERQKIRNDRLKNDRLKAAFVISRQITNTTLGKEVREALGGGYNCPFFNMGLFRELKTAAIGRTVLDSDPNSEAASEIKLIANELREFHHEHFKVR